MGQCNCRKKRKVHERCCGSGRAGTPGGDCQELTDVERAIETVINQFHCYAVKGQKEYLTPNEMQELVVQKLPHLGKCVGPLEEKIECMGDPNEAKLEFGEYWDMMGDAAKGCRRK
ncbi:protein S100-A14 [Calonectris borealis]|uniref:protein S100-A14 n=1 Tax=Calonectris borealis TaxID=1323832 RepID=UPI003F4C2324